MTIKTEYKAKDVAEAIKLACAALDVPRENLDIEVVETGSAGIFGLCRRKARILVSLKGAGEEGTALTPETRRDLSIGGTFGLGGRKKGAARPERTRRNKEERQAPRTRTAEEKSDSPLILSQETMSAIKQDLDHILKLMGFGVETSVDVEGGKLKAHINGEIDEALLGAEGQTLDGLQYIMRKIISRRFPEKIKFVLDAGSFRENRVKELEELALKLAAEVKEGGKTLSIPALNPAERRVVHMTLQNDGAIRSRSVGDGLFKKILIYLPGKGKKRPPRRRKPQPARDAE